MAVIKKMRDEKWLEPDYLLLIQSWAGEGLTIKQIASQMLVSERTLENYIKNFPEIKKAIDMGRELMVAKVENAMFQSAVGFKKEDIIVDNDGRAKKTITTLPPNPMAGFFILKHRKPAQWGDKVSASEETLVKLDQVLKNIKGNI